MALILLSVISAILFLVSLMGDSHDPMIYFAYICTGIVLLLALWGMFSAVASKPESIKSVAINVVVFLAITGISYALADNTVPEKYITDATETTSKWVGTGLYLLYILMAGSILAIVYSGINKMIK